MNKYMKIIIEVLIIIFVIAAVFIKGLFINIASQPFSFEKMFSKENIIETLIITFVLSIIVIPLKLLWDKNKKKNQEKL